MRQADFDDFALAIDAAYALHSKSLTAEARALFFAALADFSLADVRRGLTLHLRHPQRGQYPPKPADVIAQLESDPTKDGRPDANEAWAIALRSRDERDTVVWTSEAAEAFSIALAVLSGGDEVGARMAFKAAYERIVEKARAERRPVQWVKSLGHDPAMREQALSDAVRSGRLAIADVSKVLPALAAPQEVFDEQKARANLAKLHQIVGSMPGAREKIALAKEKETAREREALARAKQEAARRVAEYEGVAA